MLSNVKRICHKYIKVCGERGGEATVKVYLLFIQEKPMQLPLIFSVPMAPHTHTHTQLRTFYPLSVLYSFIHNIITIITHYHLWYGYTIERGKRRANRDWGSQNERSFQYFKWLRRNSYRRTKTYAFSSYRFSKTWDWIGILRLKLKYILGSITWL